MLDTPFSLKLIKILIPLILKVLFGLKTDSCIGLRRDEPSHLKNCILDFSLMSTFLRACLLTCALRVVNYHPDPALRRARAAACAVPDAQMQTRMLTNGTTGFHCSLTRPVLSGHFQAYRTNFLLNSTQSTGRRGSNPVLCFSRNLSKFLANIFKFCNRVQIIHWYNESKSATRSKAQKNSYFSVKFANFLIGGFVGWIGVLFYFVSWALQCLWAKFTNF